MGRYKGITTYLAERPDPVVTLTFSELDRLVEGGLPPSARAHPAWWTNSIKSHSHAKCWLDARRRAKVDFNANLVRFELGPETVYTPRRGSAVRKPDGAPISTTTLELQVTWLDGGEVTALAQKITAVPLPPIGGVYRFRFIPLKGDETIYVGESQNLATRMRQYANPGPTQTTNQNINALIKRVTGVGGRVTVHYATTVLINEEAVSLASKAVRRLVENAELVDLAGRGVKAENL